MDVRDVRTKSDIKTYLTSNLKSVDGIKDHEGWRQTLGFRRAFNIHGVYHNEKTGEYGFHVSDDNDPPVDNKYNMGKYKSYEKLIDGVANFYYTKWNLGVTTGNSYANKR